MCDTLCALGPAGTVFAKSSDRPIGEAQVVEVHDRRPAGGALHTQYLALPDAGAARVLGSRPTWLWGFEHGVNEHRVAIGNERVWTDDDPTRAPDGLIGMDLVRLALERGRTATDAVDVLTDLLEHHGQGGIADATTGEPYWSSFLVADPTDAWVVDTSGTAWAAEPVPPGGHRSISNRLSVGGGWTRAGGGVAPGTSFTATHLPADVPTGFADVRAAVTAAAAAEHRTGAALRATLRDHGASGTTADGQDAASDRTSAAVAPLPDRHADLDGAGVTVCMHVRGFQATAASMIVELDRDPDAPVLASCALGAPCVSVFVPIFLDVGGPTVLADPATWEAVDQLRRAVERATDDGGAAIGHELQLAVRAVLDPIEDELADAATPAHTSDAAARRAVQHLTDVRLPAGLAAAATLVSAWR